MLIAAEAVFVPLWAQFASGFDAVCAGLPA